MNTCFECGWSRFCETWGELKCLKKQTRIYKILGKETCEHFDKRVKGDIHNSPCQCEDCLSIRGEEEV